MSTSIFVVSGLLSRIFTVLVPSYCSHSSMQIACISENPLKNTLYTT